MKQSSKTVSSKKLSGLNCISKNPNINPAVSSESSICTWKAELDFRSLYNLCKTKSSFLFSLKSKCKPPTDSSVAELQRIKLACNSETFQDNYQYIKPRTSSLTEIFSHLLHAAVLSLPCERLLLSVKKKRNCVQRLPGNSGGPRNSPFPRDFHVRLPNIRIGPFPKSWGLFPAPAFPGHLKG